VSVPARERTQRPVLAGSGIGSGPEWPVALGAALDTALDPLASSPPHLLVVFANHAFSRGYPDLLRTAAERTGAHEIIGCSGSGVIGAEREVEGEPAIAVLAMRFPDGARVRVEHARQHDVEQMRETPGAWSARLGIEPAACTGLIVIADPFTLDVQALIDGLARDYPTVTTVGGLASGAPTAQRTFVFANSKVFGEGAVVVGFGGSVALRAVVSQGCEPIGEPWTITDADGHTVRRIGNRPAYEVLIETLSALDERERLRVSRNLLVGLAMDEYRDEFRRGDFLIRNLMGVDRSSGALSVGAYPRVGQTLQFQVRDARAADDELRHLLGSTAADLSALPAAALLFACNGRGVGLFGGPDHDVRATRELLGQPAIAGFFCNGEIGPVGGATYLHGFTASLGLFVAR
jgi:small ligand-binding sensory domain FIST